MARRTVDLSMLQNLVDGSMGQELQKGGRKSIDPNFPVFGTPVNEDVLVYIPRTTVVSVEGGEVMQVLPSLVHEGKIGKVFTSVRCIHGLVGGVYDQLGYDGTCPACEAMADVWELYNLKLNAEAKRLGVDLQNDPNDTMKATRETLLRDMDLKNAEEFVTFPICVIPTKGPFQPTDDAKDNIQVYFVHWRKKRYEDKILGALSSLIDTPQHPAGLFWLWKFTYDTGGKQANARDAAKNAKYTAISPGESARFNHLIEVCEEKAKEFTLLKAAEVIVANQFLYKEDLEAEVNKILNRTRQQLETIKISGVPQAIGGGQALQLGTSANPLANFGVTQQGANLGADSATQPQFGLPQTPPAPNAQQQSAVPTPPNPVQMG